MRLSALAIVATATCIFTSPVMAKDMHNCGDMPALPTMFDVDGAEVADIKKTAAEYKAYQDSNTRFIACLKETAKSDDIQGMKKKKRKSAMKKLDKELNETYEAEQDFADDFNDNFTKWKEKRTAKSQ